MPKIQLSKSFIRSTCKLALNEDLYPSGDITSSLLRNNTKKKAKLLANEAGIIGGLEFAKQTFKLVDKKIKIKIKKKEGSKIKLSKKYIYKICKDALKEDLYPSGDITSKLLNNTNKIKAKISL